MAKRNALITLAMMEAIAGTTIPQKPKKIAPISIVRHGDLNKKCLGCGHKNKKCTCVGGPSNG